MIPPRHIFPKSIGSNQIHGPVGPHPQLMGLGLKLRILQKTVNLIYLATRVMQDIVFILFSILIKWNNNTGCGGNYSNSSGILSSPLFPNVYPHNQDCSYLISQPYGNFINLNITEMDMDCYSMGSDYLELRDGISEDSPLIGRFCGHNVPEFLQTTQNYLWAR